MGYVLLNMGFVAMLLSLTMRDVLWLRAIMMSAQAMIFTGDLFEARFNVAVWNVVFISVNAYRVLPHPARTPAAGDSIRDRRHLSRPVLEHESPGVPALLG